MDFGSSRWKAEHRHRQGPVKSACLSPGAIITMRPAPASSGIRSTGGEPGCLYSTHVMALEYVDIDLDSSIRHGALGLGFSDPAGGHVSDRNDSDDALQRLKIGGIASVDGEAVRCSRRGNEQVRQA
jgi:hypothetical protein